MLAAFWDSEFVDYKKFQTFPKLDALERYLCSAGILGSSGYPETRTPAGGIINRKQDI